MAHYLYVLQSVTLNHLEPRMRTPLDCYSQVSQNTMRENSVAAAATTFSKLLLYLHTFSNKLGIRSFDFLEKYQEYVHGSD